MTDKPTSAEHQCKPDAALYFCPSSGEVESDCHGGFDTCCSNPELHLPMPDTQATAAVSKALDQAKRRDFQARETNRRLNYRCQQAESRLATFAHSVGEWQISDHGTYVPLRTLTAIAKAAGRDIDDGRYELHYQRVEHAEAERDLLRGLMEKMPETHMPFGVIGPDDDHVHLAHELRRAETALDRVRELHRPDGVPDLNGAAYCTACHEQMPCPTLRALERQPA